MKSTTNKIWQNIQATTQEVKLYFFYLIPVSLFSINVNYSFLLSHAFQRHRKPRDKVLKLFIPYVFICYILGLFTTVPLGAIAVVRQFLSLLAFLSVWSITFILFEKKDIQALLKTVAAIAVVYSLWVLCVIIFNPVLHQHIFNSVISIYMRSYIWAWPQYFIPILVFSLIYLSTRRYKQPLHIVAILLIIVCLFFTYNNSTYLLLFFAYGFYFFVKFVRIIKNKQFKKLAIISSSVLGSGFLAVLLLRNTEFYELLIGQIQQTLGYFRSIFDSDIQQDPTVYIRIFQWQASLDFLLNTNPITGSGYAGLYLLPQAASVNYVGGIDGQFLETLLKMGFLGTAFFMYFYWKLFHFYFKFDLGVCCAIIAFILYGATHTTYLSPYNGFLFFALLSFADSQNSKNSIQLQNEQS